MGNKQPYAILGTLCYLYDIREGIEHTLMLLRPNLSESGGKDFHAGNYVAPGGSNEPGEIDMACVVREFNEEAGIHLINPVYRGRIYFDNKHRVFSQGLTKPDHSVAVYECHAFSGQLRESKAGKLLWVPKKELTQLNMWPGDRLIPQWLSKEGYASFEAVQRYQGKNLASWEIFYHMKNGGLVHEKSSI